MSDITNDFFKRFYSGSLLISATIKYYLCVSVEEEPSCSSVENQNLVSFLECCCVLYFVTVVLRLFFPLSRFFFLLNFRKQLYEWFYSSINFGIQ